jgi:hypothetical protein
MDENEKSGLSPDLLRILTPEYQRRREEKRRLAREQRERMERNIVEIRQLLDSLER